MKSSFLTIALLVGAAVYTNGKRFQVKTLAQASVIPTINPDPHADTAGINNGIDSVYDWAPVGTGSLYDVYGNMMVVASGYNSLTYTDKAGVVWTRSNMNYDGATTSPHEVWSGHDTFGNSWTIDITGKTQAYYDWNGDAWYQESNKTETFISANGKVARTEPSGDQWYFDCTDVVVANSWVARQDCPKYHYFVNGDEEYTAGFINTSNYFGWFWDESAQEIKFRDALPGMVHSGWAVTTFGGYESTGYVIDEFGRAELIWDKVLKQFVFVSPPTTIGSSTYPAESVFYYGEFAWGNNAQTWYLKNDYHDFYVQTGGYWP